MNSLKIFNNNQHPLIVAPMQGVTDYSFRQTLEHLGGMDCFLSEFIVVADDNSYSKREIKDVIKSYENKNLKTPLIPQLISGSPIGAVKVSQELNEAGIQSIDINMGCPTKSSINGKRGAYHSENPLDAEKIIAALRKVTPHGLSVKTRIGNTTTKNFQEFLKMIRNNGVDFMTLHCRLATTGYYGQLFTEHALEASQYLQIPIIYNGGIIDPRSTDSINIKLKTSGVMIGKAAMQNPWIFKQAKEFITTGEVTAPNKTEFKSFFQTISKNYLEDSYKQEQVLKKLKQLISSFKYEGITWKEFTRKLKRQLTIHDFMNHLNEIDEEMLSKIGEKKESFL